MSALAPPLIRLSSQTGHGESQTLPVDKDRMELPELLDVKLTLHTTYHTVDTSTMVNESIDWSTNYLMSINVEGKKFPKLSFLRFERGET